MLCIYNNNTDPYFNIACEEYLFKEKQEDCFLLYRNDKSVVVGKHQNALAEINYSYIKKNSIKVVRRITGGGAVYHDLGNINFTFIKKNQEGNLADINKNLKLIMEVLLKAGIQAEVGIKNDLIFDNKKFSGNAEHIYLNSLLHHGTILFSTDLFELSNALDNNLIKYQDKAVKSVKSKVVNLGDYILPKMDASQFATWMMNHIIEKNSNYIPYQLSDLDNVKILKLIENKYSSWEWNFAYSPAYHFHNRITYPKGEINIILEVDKGVIKQIRFIIENMKNDVFTKIEKECIGCNHEENALKTKFKNISIQGIQNYITIDDLINNMF